MASANRIESALERVALVADAGSFEPWFEQVVSHDPYDFHDSRPYTERLASAREKTGSSESVACGGATLEGRPVGIVAAEFGFLGGSIGVATGERVARLLERCQAERRPVVALPASGGTRMQEGTAALMQMAKLAAAVSRFRAAGLAYLVCLTHPVTGGVLASWGSLGTVSWALPGALIGFGGPRVVELMTGTALPPGVQVAEHLLAHGQLDDVILPSELRERAARALRVAAPQRHHEPSVAVAEEERIDPSQAEGDACASLARSRDPRRPSTRDLIERAATDVTLLRGDRTGAPDDPSCLVALAAWRGVPVVVVAQHRDGRAHGRSVMGPAGFRKARRGMALAAELGLPLVTLIDTPGAEMSVLAEEGGMAGEIARCLAAMSCVPSPTLAVILGEGGSGGALALLPADRVVCAQHGNLAPIAPEGASAILYRTTDRAEELANSQGIGSWELERLGIVDLIVSERPSAEQEPDAFLERMAAVVGVELRALLQRDPGDRLGARERRYREVGNPRG